MIDDNDLGFIMSQVQGRRFIWQLLELSGPFRSNFDTNHAQMSFNEGRRSLGVELLAQLTASYLKEYLLMVKENQINEDQINDRQRTAE